LATKLQDDPDFVKLAQAWDGLPDDVKSEILLIVWTAQRQAEAEREKR